MSVNRSRCGFVSFAASSWSRSSRHDPSFGRGCTRRLYSNAVAPERTTLRTVFRDTFNPRAISLIDLPLIKCSRLIRPIVSTTSIPRHPLASPSGQPADHIATGVKMGRRSPPYRGQFSTPKHRQGLAYARSAEFYDTTLFWQWMRMPGDIVFALGALLMAWDFLLKLPPFFPRLD